MWGKAVAGVAILAFAALATVGCGGGGTSTVTVVHRRTVPVPSHKPVRKLMLSHRALEGPRREPGKQRPTSLPCPERTGGRVKTIEIYSDVETCTRVAPRDRLLFVNATGSGPEHVEPTPIELSVGDYEAFIGDGESALFQASVGSYLGIGLHETDSHADAPAPEILVLPEGCAIEDPEPGKGLCYAAGAPPCPGAKLLVREGRAGAGLGTVYIRMQVVNRSRRTCSVEGKPLVEALDARGHRIGPPAARSGLTTTMTGNHQRSIALGPGDAAIFELNYGEAADYGPPPCGIREAKWLEVTLPPAGPPQRVPFEMQRCAVQGFHVGRIE